LHDLLSDRLLRCRDAGYDVSLVSGQAHNCDISVRRLGRADVRIESKAIGLGTGEKVRAAETAKFVRDLTELNVHGIFVSLHSGIVGKARIELDAMPNGKYAVYLSHNEYDVDIIADMLELLYRLDVLTCKDDAEVRVSAEALKRAQAHLLDFATKVRACKTHMKESLSLLNEMAFDVIERALSPGTTTAQLPVASAQLPVASAQLPVASAQLPVASAQLECAVCAKTFGTAKGLAAHRKKCKVIV
jgi:hypothetical protein